MEDYNGWAKWLETMYTDLQSKVVLMNRDTNTQRDNVTLRKDYIQICSEWLVVCDVMRNRIQNAKDRTTRQVEKLTN